MSKTPHNFIKIELYLLNPFIFFIKDVKTPVKIMIKPWPREKRKSKIAE